MSKLHTSTQILQGNALFSGKIYTAGNIFTRPPVVTVAKNFKSVSYITESHDPLAGLGEYKSKTVTKIMNTWFDVDQGSTSTSELFVHVLFAKTSSTRLVAGDQA